jgi:cell wall assembly regulator SMI1
VAGPLLSRALACWRRIEAYLQQHSPQILATLNPGATPEQVQQAEEELGHALPLAVRCIYRWAVVLLLLAVICK